MRPPPVPWRGWRDRLSQSSRPRMLREPGEAERVWKTKEQELTGPANSQGIMHLFYSLPV